MNVMIDPGHGGRDPGAVGTNPWTLRESEVVWSVAGMTRLFLKLAAVGVSVTRRQGEYVSTRERARIANIRLVDAFVSIHCNAHSRPGAGGVEVLHYGSASGEALARRVLEALYADSPGMSGLTNRGLKVRPGLNVLRLTRMPAVLIELPFISNPAELRLLADPERQVRWARQIATGITGWLGAA